MANNSLRRMPNRGKSTLALAVMIGLVLSYVSWISWRHFCLTGAQNHLFGLYFNASVPYPKTIPAKQVDAYLGGKSDFPMYDKAVLKASLKERFDSETVPQLLKPIAIWIICLLGLSVFAGSIWQQYILRKAREWTYLRGPQWKTYQQYNKLTKGDGFALDIEI